MTEPTLPQAEDPSAREPSRLQALIVRSYRDASSALALAASICKPGILIASTRAAADEFVWHSGQGSLGLHRFTLPQLAAQMADEALTPLTQLAQEALVARAIDELRRTRELGYFSPVADMPGFVRAAAATLNELRLNGVPPQGDLGPLHRRYTELLEAARLADLAELYTRALEAEESRFFGLPLLLLDVPVRHRLERQFLDRLIAQAPSATILTLEGDPEPCQAAVPPTAVSVDSGQALDRVRRYVFAPEPPPEATLDPTVAYFAAPGESLECVEIARRIQRCGLPFDRIAILLRHPDRYQPLVEEALRRAGIPGWFSHGTVRPDPAGRAFLALLNCALENLSATRFAEYLSLAQVPQLEAGPVAPFAWEQLIVDAAVIGGAGRWRRRLDGLARELRLHEAPLYRIEQLDRLRDFALPLIERLADLPTAAPWGRWLQVLAELASAALRSTDAVDALLEELEPMRDIGPVTLEEVQNVLSERLGLLRVEPPPRRFGQVFVGTIEEARGRAFEVVYLPGLAEGLFPRRAQEDPLLLDTAREPLGLAVQSTRIARERLLLRIAAAAGDRLVVSYPTMDTGQSRPRVPSFYALEVLRAATGHLPGLREFEEAARASAAARLGWPAPAEPTLAIDDAEYDLAILGQQAQRPTPGAAHYLIAASPTLVRSMRSRGRRWRSKWYGEDGLIESLPELAAHRLAARPYSATALQTFASCPYHFLLRAIHRLAPREQPVAIEQMDPLTRGTLFHEVQRRFFEKLSPWQVRPLPELLDEMDEVLNATAAQYAEDLAPAIPRVWESEVEDLRTDLRGWLREMSYQPEWVPLKSEFSFEQTVLGAQLHGRIDLVEEHRDRGTLRVTDHKTGKPPAERPAFVGKGRVLQPVLYAAALEEAMKRTVEMGRLSYATQRGGYQETEIRLTDTSRHHATEVLRIIDESIAKGFLPAAPDQGACEHCDYRMVCGPYEEKRVLRKQTDQLMPLFALRALP
ncbi:MAG: exodeoxyribonuclease V subunit gamma [Acidobacteria bacterium]|nr:exodeoxyribonuclease V subunit gamma [Acidobacteriota bacterium]